MLGTAQAMPTVLCCVCSTAIDPNPTNMCLNCIRTTVNITEDIPPTNVINSCRGCKRWMGPPWMECERESRELLYMCLKKIPGLSKVKLIDAAWIWTEPHSRRLKIKLTIQKEVMNSAVLQQALVVEFAERNQQCPECQASYAQGMWKSLVQVRQRVPHKRTFLHLEQLILKHGAHTDCLSLEAFRDGMDFYFAERNQAVRFCEFLSSVVPVTVKASKKLIGADVKSNLYNYKYNYMVEIAPICKDDLVILPRGLARDAGDIAQLCLVQRISNCIHAVDPTTCQSADISINKYGQEPFRALMHTKRLVPFVVLSIEPRLAPERASARKKGQSRKLRLAECVVARESDLGTNDQQFVCMTHLGHVLKTGDTVLGYDLTTSNLDEEMESLNRAAPDIVLVRKFYDKNRKWQLKQLEFDATEDIPQKIATDHEDDYEAFLQQVAADREMRSQLNLYKRELAQPSMFEETKGEEGNGHEDMDEEEVRMDELLDGLTLAEPVEYNVISTEEATHAAEFTFGQQSSGNTNVFSALDNGDDDDEL